MEMHQNYFLKRFCVVLVVSIVFALPNVAFAQLEAEEIPDDVDSSNAAGWWEPMAIHGDEVYMAYNSRGPTKDTHTVSVAKRDANGEWEVYRIEDANGNVWVHGDDRGHDQPTIAVDGSGHIHLWLDHHNDPWRYYKTERPGDISSLVQFAFGKATDSITYPIASTAPNGDVFLIARNYLSCHTREGVLFRFDHSTGEWSREAVVGREEHSVFYPTDLDVDSDGNVHILFEWAKGNSGGLRHWGSYLKYNPKSKTFHSADEAEVAVPVGSEKKIMNFLPLQKGEAFNGRNCTYPGQVAGMGIQGAELAWDPVLRRPSIAYRYRTSGSAGLQDYDVYLTRWNGTMWDASHELIYDDGDTFAALGVSAYNGRERVYFAKAGYDEGVYLSDSHADFAPKRLLEPDPIQRLVVMSQEQDGDAMYATAPREISSNEGRLYFVRIPY